MSKNTASRWYKPALLQLAAVLFWAALHMPLRISMATGVAWALSALTVGLLTKAGLALLEPASGLIIKIGRAQMQNNQNETHHS